MTQFPLPLGAEITDSEGRWVVSGFQSGGLLVLSQIPPGESAQTMGRTWDAARQRTKVIPQPPRGGEPS